MKKFLVVIMSIILILAIPISASAGYAKGFIKAEEEKIKEVPMEISLLPEEIFVNDEVEVTFTISRSGSVWEYGEISGLIKPETIFDEENWQYHEPNDTTQVPIPNSLILFGTGLVGLLTLGPRRKPENQDS